MRAPSAEELFIGIKPEEKNEVKYLERRHLEEDSYKTKLYELGKGPKKENERNEGDSDDECEDEYRQYAFRCIEYHHRYGNHVQRSLEIKSKVVKEALDEMKIDYPGISFSSPDVKLNFPLNPLWPYREQLNELSRKEQEKNTELGQHLGTLMKFLTHEWAQLDKEFHYWTDVGLITYELLWTIFASNTLIYTTVYGQPRVFSLDSFNYLGSKCEGKFARLSATYIDYDGTKFGEGSMNFDIKEFDGSKKIVELQVFPLDRHPEQKAVRERLIERGTKLVALQGYHCKKYNGLTVGCKQVRINTRLMIDALSSGRYSLRSIPKAPGLKRKRKDYDIDDMEHDRDDDEDLFDIDEEGNPVRRSKTEKPLELTDGQKLLCNATVWGFTLDDSKCWEEILIDKLQDIAWNQESFSKLVLPNDTKELIRGLVESHICQERTRFDDFIKGKGKGLIAVLHGPPGLGKTMTAETVAEYTKSPLYTISAGSLGTRPSELESGLQHILKLAERWKAVVLLDEADVYLEERSLHDVQRNALVSIFLRLVEYYQGILFLTTNRVKTFDDAFQSRIHVALRYSKLTLEARTKIWKNFVATIDSNKTSVSEEDYMEVARVELNGRQIKNAIRTALSTADTCGEKLALKHFKIVLGVMSTFEKDLTNLTDG
ncbi:Spastin [Dactylellina cionopaga]|nr:Spastin [Dactylellina cionopaga]